MTGDGRAVNPAHDRRIETIAAAWQAATAGIAYIPFPVDEIRARYERLAAGALDALIAAEPLETTARRGRAIGRELVALNLLKPEALERTLTVLSGELASVGEPERMSHLLAGVAGGFTGAVEATLLAQQEAIGRAATVALRRTQSELETSRNSLVEINRELSEQITERTRAEEVQRDYAERLQRLHQIDLAVLSAESLPAIVDISIDYIQRLIPALTVSIALFDLVNNQSIILRSNSDLYPSGRSDPISLTDALDVLKEGRLIYLPNLAAMREQSPGIAEIVDRGGRSFLAVPLRYRGELIGGLIIILPEARPFTTAEETVAREIADSVAVAIQNRQLLDAEQAIRERETSLREVAASLTLGLDLDEVLDRILAHLDRVVVGQSATIMLLEGGALTVTAERGTHSTPEQMKNLLAARPRSIWSVLESARPRIINDTDYAPDWIGATGWEYIRSWLGVPLMVKGDCIGIMIIDRDQPNAFNEQDVALAVTFANQAAIAIENARLFRRQQEYAGELEKRVRERTRELEVLYGITAAAVEKPDLESLLQRSLELATNAFACPAGAIHLIEGEEGGFQLAAVHSQGEPLPAEVLRGLIPNDPILLRPFHLSAPSILSGPDLPETWPGEPTQVIVGVPLRSSGQSLGVLSLISDSPDRFAGTALTLLTTIADQIASAVETIKLRQITRRSAIIEERERLAREIHDSVTQAIYSVVLFADGASKAASAGNLDKVQQHTRTIMSVTDQALRELRLLLFELRTESLARLGLVGALRERVLTVEQRAGIQANVRARGTKSLPIALEETYYRIALGALNNALLHAHAGRIDVTLSVKGGELVMTIADDGVGFDPETAAGSGGMGLDAMQKRIGQLAGVLTVESRSGGGTKVTARAPLGPPGGNPVGQTKGRESR